MTTKQRALKWFGGYDSECVWLKYGAKPDWTLSVVRCWDTPSIEFAIRVSDPASTNLDIPGYAPFAIEAGTNESAAAIEGIGTLEQHAKGRVIFRAGDMDIEDPYSLFVARRWASIARPPLLVHVGQLKLPIPIDLSIFTALTILTAKEKQFEEAVRNHSIYVRDGT